MLKSRDAECCRADEEDEEVASTKVDCFIRQAGDEPSCKARKRQQEVREGEEEGTVHA